MTSWHTGRLCLVDFETTGIDPHRDRVVTAAIIEVGNGEPARTREWLINPGIPIPAEAAAVHGITDEQAAGGADADAAIYEIVTHLLACSRADMVVVGYNVSYDLTMLYAEATRHELGGDYRDELGGIAPVVDPFILDKQLDRYRKGSRKLIDVCRHHGIELTEAEAHGATADALAAGRLAWMLAQNNSAKVGGDPMRLHAKQIEWKREQAESFGAYLTRQGKTDDVSREWPIQSPPADWSPDQLPAPRQEQAS